MLHLATERCPWLACFRHECRTKKCPRNPGAFLFMLEWRLLALCILLFGIEVSHALNRHAHSRLARIRNADDWNDGGDRATEARRHAETGATRTDRARRSHNNN